LNAERDELAEMLQVGFFLYNDNDTRPLAGILTIMERLPHRFSPFLCIIELDRMGICQAIDSGLIWEAVFLDAMVFIAPCGLIGFLCGVASCRGDDDRYRKRGEPLQYYLLERLPAFLL